ncbi:MAG: hypothetical protein DMG03_06490 [Acidobacteria bacterium]|nr:MAG: hypothetical protein DMG03_06490 [Acidobacteriota bacterium]
MASNVCEGTGLPRRVVKPRALTFLRTSCFVKRPVAKSWKARRTSGARSGSEIRLRPVDRCAFR